MKLECEGFTGYGESSLPPYLGETHESVIKFYQSAKTIIEKENLSSSLENIIMQFDELSDANNDAKAGIDIALHDLFSKAQNKQVWEFLALQKPVPKNTSITISIGELSLIPQKLEEAKEFNILKIKLGNANDKEI